MPRQDYYTKVKELTEKAVDCIKYDLDGNYNGYTEANAVSMYLYDNHDINVVNDNQAQRAFEDVLDN